MQTSNDNTATNRTARLTKVMAVTNQGHGGVRGERIKEKLKDGEKGKPDLYMPIRSSVNCKDVSVGLVPI